MYTCNAIDSIACSVESLFLQSKEIDLANYKLIVNTIEAEKSSLFEKKLMLGYEAMADRGWGIWSKCSPHLVEEPYF